MSLLSGKYPAVRRFVVTCWAALWRRYGLRPVRPRSSSSCDSDIILWMMARPWLLRCRAPVVRLHCVLACCCVACPIPLCPRHTENRQRWHCRRRALRARASGHPAPRRLHRSLTPSFRVVAPRPHSSLSRHRLLEHPRCFPHHLGGHYPSQGRRSSRHRQGFRRPRDDH